MEYEKELEVKHDGARYHVSPWGLLWNDGNYYLIGYDHDTQVKDIRHYRVDKMKNILIEIKSVRAGRSLKNSILLLMANRSLVCTMEKRLRLRSCAKTAL